MWYLILTTLDPHPRQAGGIGQGDNQSRLRKMNFFCIKLHIIIFKFFSACNLSLTDTRPQLILTKK